MEVRMELYRVNGDSMNPLLKDGDKIFGVEEFSLEKLKPFDLLVFDYKGVSYCHYFWRICENFKTEDGELVQTRPLNPIWEVDDPIPLASVKAKIISKKIGPLLKLKVLIYSYFLKRGR